MSAANTSRDWRTEIKERNGDHKDDDESDVQTPGATPGSIGSRGGVLESLAENPVLVGEDAHQRADEGQLEVEMEIKEHEEKSLNQQDSVALPVPDAPPAVVKPICSCDFCNHREAKRFRAGLKKPASARPKSRKSCLSVRRKPSWHRSRTTTSKSTSTTREC